MQQLEPLLSARFNAVFRLVICVVFMAAAFADPDQPVRNAMAGYAIVTAFLGWAVVNVWAAFRDWWIEFPLARAALAVDIVAGIAAVYFTEGSPEDFASPIAAVLVYILIEALFLGGWRLAIASGLAFVAGMLAVIMMLTAMGMEPDLVRAGRRIGFFVIIIALAVWLGARRTSPRVPAFTPAPDTREAFPAAAALDFAKASLGASDGLVVLRTANQDADDAPAGQPPLPADAPVLFRIGSRKALGLGADETVVPHAPVDVSDVATIPRGTDALSIPIRTEAFEAVLLLWGIAAASRDLLPVAHAIRAEIEAGLNRHLLALRAVEDRMGEVRQSIARDLHDSVAQSLAGASFRVEAARRTLEAGGDGDELRAVQEALLAEQRNVREIIERLRSGREIRLRHDLVADLGGLFNGLERQWNLTIGLSAPDEPLMVGTAQLHEVRQVCREAVANAARHGEAVLIRFSLEVEKERFHLDIVDNGVTADGSSHPFRPQSIAERVAALGGTLNARRGPAGTRLYITVPRLSA